MSEPRVGTGPSRVGASPVVVILGVTAVVAALAVAMSVADYDVWGAFWVGPVLLALTVPIANHMAKQEQDPRVGRLILLAFTAKVVVGSTARYITVNGVYGKGDSKAYSTAGRILAPLFRHLEYHDLGKVSGTRFIEIVTGQIFAFIGPSDLGAYFVFSWLAFLGLVLLVRAFRIAVPEGDHRRYRYLVLFFPTLLFWPSSIGKDAWMLLCIGLAAYGLARALRGSLLVGGVSLGLGIWWAAIVRPHIALLLIVAAVAAVVVRSVSPTSRGSTGFARVGSVLLAIVLLGGILAVTSQAEQFFSLDRLDPDSAQTVIDEVTRRTGQGGSEFDAPSASTPGGYAQAFVTVLFRPFPLEGGGGLSLLTAGEGMLFLAIVLLSLSRLSRFPALGLRDPYLIFALTYLLAFVYAFSSIENFGILARQRAQLLPLAFAMLALPRKPAPDHRSERGLLARRRRAAREAAAEATPPSHLASGLDPERR